MSTEKSEGNASFHRKCAEDEIQCDKYTDEDIKIQDDLKLLMSTLREPQKNLYLPALNTIKEMIRCSTTSITSVPKPLKYMSPYYQEMKKIYNKLKDTETKERCADIISVLAMTMGQERDCINYRLLADSKENVCSWGHEYVRHLSSEITAAWPEATKPYLERLKKIVHDIIPYTLEHNAEAEACDLLSEIDQLEILDDYIEECIYPKVSLYLLSCASYVAEPENINLLKFVLKLTKKFNRPVEGMRVAFMLNDIEEIRQIYENVASESIKKQLAFLIGKQRVNLDTFDTANETYSLIGNNIYLNKYFISLCRELDILDPKSPEHIYKTNLEHNRLATSQPDSARANLASSIVNGFVNAGFGTDEMFRDYGTRWIYKTKDEGKISAAASIGLIHLWDVDGGLAQIDKYLYSTDDMVQAGVLLGCGLLNCGVRNDIEPAHAILSDYFQHQSKHIRLCSILGTGIAYAGTNSDLALESLRNTLQNCETIELLGICSLSIGLVAVGTCSAEDTELILEQIIKTMESKIESPYTRFIYLSLGLLYLGAQGQCETILETIKILNEPYYTYTNIILEMCAYAGSGNVLKVQRFLHICSEHSNSDKKGSDSSTKDRKRGGYEKFDFSEIQIGAVLGVSLISMGDEIGNEMSFRTFGHLMRYGEPWIRKTVPLAIALGSISNPKVNILETLNKFSHDNDINVAQSAILALGLIGAGTNNARLSHLLRQLAQYYYKDPSTLFMVRISQGISSMGKGTMTLSPYHSHGQVLKLSSLAAIISTLFATIDIKGLILDSSHYLLYLLTPAIDTRCLMTFDEDLNQINVQVRVGMAVDVVAQAGKPKTITGFQTNNTPVLLNAGERAELATEEYVSLSPVLEGFVILQKNSMSENKCDL